MKRDDFIKIVKLRSTWKIDKRKGNYKLPNGKMLSAYVEYLMQTQMELDHLAIADDGNLYVAVGGNWNRDRKEFASITIMPDFTISESCSFDEQEKRVHKLLHEIIY